MRDNYKLLATLRNLENSQKNDNWSKDPYLDKIFEFVKHQRPDTQPTAQFSCSPPHSLSTSALWAHQISFFSENPRVENIQTPKRRQYKLNTKRSIREYLRLQQPVQIPFTSTQYRYLPPVQLDSMACSTQATQIVQDLQLPVQNITDQSTSHNEALQVFRTTKLKLVERKCYTHFKTLQLCSISHLEGFERTYLQVTTLARASEFESLQCTDNKRFKPLQYIASTHVSDLKMLEQKYYECFNTCEDPMLACVSDFQFPIVPHYRHFNAASKSIHSGIIPPQYWTTCATTMSSTKLTSLLQENYLRAWENAQQLNSYRDEYRDQKLKEIEAKFQKIANNSEKIHQPSHNIPRTWSDLSLAKYTINSPELGMLQPCSHPPTQTDLDCMFVGYVAVAADCDTTAKLNSLPPDPVLYSIEMEDDDEVIICFDGVGAYTAYKRYKQDSSEILQVITAHKDLGQALTAYKRVDRKVKPVPGVFPEDAKVIRRFPENPLASLQPLPIKPPKFVENGRLTQERLEAMKLNPDGFLWPEEEKLFHHILQLHQNTFVFEDSQRGSFREDYFTPYIIPVVPHEPWAFANIPIPPGIKERVMQLLKEKMDAGVYELCQSSYRSRWFCVLKKNGKLRIVHDLQPLNKVTIKEAGLPPNLDSFVEPFAGRQCYTVFDLYWGFDARKVHPKSRDLSAFQTPLGLLRITSLPTGFTNSPAEFQACMTFILQHEIPHIADIFIDDLPIKGPDTRYEDEDGNPEVLTGNPGIRRFIWEHAQDVHRIIHRVAHAGGTFSPTKVQLARPEALIVGHKCTPNGRLPDDQKIEKIINWPTLTTVKEVRGFLGLCGTVRIWIKDYSAIARPLTELVRKTEDFVWDDRRESAFQQLKKLITTAPALHPIDYNSDNPVILSVDSSIIAVGFILSQIDDNGKKRPARYGSIPMNERESRYSQPKIELYGLFRALRAYRLYLVGVKRLIVEVDAKYIKGMLNEPDLQPNATINRWIQGILLFDFELVHVPADRHRGPDALSRRRLGGGEEIIDEDDSWLDNIALYTVQPKASYLDSLAKAFEIQETDTLSPQDQTLHDIYHFLTTLETPQYASSQDKRRFIVKATRFFVQNQALYRRNGNHPPLKAILDPQQRTRILEAAHEHLGHRGEHAVMHTVKERFYWPSMWNDVRHHVRSCHQCQIRSTYQVRRPITISAPTKIFARIYLDCMYMPVGRGFRYLIAARDDMSGAAEGRALRSLTAKAVAQFFWEQILCRYGAVFQVTTDNGPEVKEAFTKLMNRYGISQIKISPYNSRANGVVERGHFTIREAIMKTCQHNPQHWPDYVSHAFFADRVTVRRQTGYSPYYLLYGVDPLLPFDLAEASFMIDNYESGMSTTDLLASRIRQLQKKPDDLEKAAITLREHRLRSKEQFERKFQARLVQRTYSPGSLVLVRNTTIEKELNKKSKPRYLGPYEVVRARTGGDAYILRELDGTIWKQSVAAFRLIPYISRNDKRLHLLADTSANSTADESDANDNEASSSEDEEFSHSED